MKLSTRCREFPESAPPLSPSNMTTDTCESTPMAQDRIDGHHGWTINKAPLSPVVSVGHGHQITESIIPSEIVINEFFNSSQLYNKYNSIKAFVIAHQIWDILLSIFALADFCGSMAKRLPPVEPSPIPMPLDANDKVVFWLQENANFLSILFSLGWFIDALLGAHQWVIQTEQRLEKEICQNMELEHPWWRTARSVYYQTIAIEILMLPSGLFVLIHDQFRKVMDMNIHLSTPVHSHHNDNGEPTRQFSSYFSMSLISLSIHHLLLMTMVHTRLHSARKAKLLAYRLLHRAFRHPRQFYRRLHKFLRLVRWTKYLAPLIGTANKLKGNIDDLRKMRKQRREANVAKAIRIKLWNNLPDNKRREMSAVVIQKTFRARRARKMLFVLSVLKGQQETVAAIKLQKYLRAWLARARLQIKIRMLHLEELKRKRVLAHQKIQGVTLSGKEGRRLYLLQKELEEKAKSALREKLLLRPNTTFAVTWKALFVIAVLFEISVLAFQPLLSKYTDKKSGKPLNLESILDNKLIPTPVAKLPECGYKEPLNLSLFRPIKSVQSLFRTIQQRRHSRKKHVKPWYCGKMHSSLQSAYSSMAAFAIHKFLVLLGLVCFMDVFITFFTGKYDENGTLAPKAFLERWIFPGFLFQLLVNPAMEEVSSLISVILDFSFRHDPIRVVRWTLVIFWPFSLWTFRHVRKIWYDFATMQNQHCTRDLSDKFTFQW